MSKRSSDDRDMRERLEAILAGASVAAQTVAPEPASTDGGSAPDAVASRLCMGEVVETHNPHLLGRVLVLYRPTAGRKEQQWLLYERHLSLRIGDRVMLTQPVGWPEWLVTGAYGRNSAAAHAAPGPAPTSPSASPPRELPAPLAARPATKDTAAQGAGEAMQQATQQAADFATDSFEPSADHVRDVELRLEPGQGVRVLGHDGRLLVTLKSGPDGPVAELGSDDVELSAKRRLRLSAGTVEVKAGHGGVDLRTDGDAVVRARTIRLN